MYNTEKTMLNMRRLLLLSPVAWAVILSMAQAQFNNPEGVDIWCGKAYRATNSSFDPGGWFEEPPRSDVPLLNLRVRPRMSIYLDTDTTGSLLIDAGVSDQVGQALPARYGFSNSSSGPLDVVIMLDDVVLQTTSVDVGSTEIEVPLELDAFPASLDAYNVSIQATLDGKYVYTASTDFLRLPYPQEYGSVSRLDNLYGGLWVQRGDEEWKHIFPYTYYVQWSLYWDNNVTTLDDFASMGYNVIHIVPTGTLGDKPFPWDQFEPYLQRADELGLYFQYDVIWDWANLSGMVEQVEGLKTHPSMLLWYQSDEADGKSNPINSTGIAYQRIRELDPYHPVSLTLNCYDFYYADYAAGADIIMSDVYPIAVDTSFSDVYGTVCNTTYGCCGCDDCEGQFEDISNRIDEFRRRDDLLGWTKTQWVVPQAFGNETFWTRYPTAAEEVVMTMLSINHGAKGIVMWDYPTTAELLHVTDQLAAVLTGDAVTTFLLETPRTQTLQVTGASRVDAAAWIGTDGKQLLLSVVNLNYGQLTGTIEVKLPDGVKVDSVVETLWGDLVWNVQAEDSVYSADGMLGLQVSLVLLNLAS